MDKKTKKKISSGDIVRITFLDAFGRGGWNGWEEIKDGLEDYITADIVGYYIKEDKNFVVLSMGIQLDPSAKAFLHLEFIPKGAIVIIRKENWKLA